MFVGDRGMVTQARVRGDLEPNSFDWIFALRAPAVRSLADGGALQPSLFDQRDMAEIESREQFPGERLIVCRNPMLAEQRTRKRNELIKATAEGLTAIARAVRRDKRPLRSDPPPRSPKARRKAAAKRTRSGKAVHDFRGRPGHLGTLTMNRIEPSEPGKRSFNLPSSPTPVQDQALRLLNAKIAKR